MKKTILTLAIMFFGNTVYADNVVVYRWVDENNVVHFSQHQPEHNNYTELTMTAMPKSSQAPVASPESENNEQVASNEEVKIASMDKCKTAQENVRTLQNFDKIQYTDENGQLKVLSDLEKAQQLEINQKQVEVYCREQ